MGNGTSDLDSTDGRPPSPSKEEVDSLQLPSEFSQKYEVLSSVGKGGFGSVYKVRDIKTKAVYAVKILSLTESNQREVRIAVIALSRLLPCNPNDICDST